MGDVLLIAILVASFALAIALIQAVNRMLERGTSPGELADEPPDVGTPDYGNPGDGVVGPLGWRM
jgi:hypothetical protein